MSDSTGRPPSAAAEPSDLLPEQLPDERGFFGPFGGRYVPEMLAPALDELDAAYRRWKDDEEFQKALNHLYRDYSGRPTPLYFAENFSASLRKNLPAGRGPRVYLKQEGLGATGAHKINHCLGQALLAETREHARDAH